MKLNQVEQVARKTKSLQLKYNEFNKPNWKSHNDLKHLQSEHESMIQDYNKMEQSSIQQEKIITSLEQTCQELKEQLANI
jgi:hypothetical protein